MLSVDDTNSIEVDFLLDGMAYAGRSVVHVPSVGDHVRFHGVLYAVTGRLWMYDVAPVSVALVIEHVTET
jgi:hypothetical protein